jgi:hypothetical protein
MQQQIRDLSSTKKVMVKISYVFLENHIFNNQMQYKTRKIVLHNKIINLSPKGAAFILNVPCFT